jgi:lysophospholipase L1-like esterase
MPHEAWAGGERMEMNKPDKTPLRGGKTPPPRYWLIRVAFFFILLAMPALLLAVFEFGARWYFRDVLSTSHGRDYFFLKNHRLFKAERNGFGMRGGEIRERTGRTYRVVVLGDSLAWGQGIHPYTSRFPEVAEKIFRERYPEADIEVINVAAPGLNLREHNEYLPFVINLDPDFVLYQWYVNDMEKHVDVQAFHAATLVPKKEWHLALMNRSVTYILLFRTWNQVRAALGLQKPYSSYLVEKMRDPDSEASRWADNSLHQLISTLQGWNIATGIVLFPECRADMTTYGLGFLHDRVLAECRRDKITCLDLREAYAAYDGRVAELQASPLDAHPSKAAHRLAAERIVETFGPGWQAAMAQRAGRQEGRQ